MRGIIIDSDINTNMLVELNKDDILQDMYDLLGCRMVEIGYRFPNGDVLFVDEEGLNKLNDYTRFFQIDNCQPLVGSGIIIGSDDLTGVSVSVKTNLEDLEVKFLSVMDVLGLVG